MNISRILIVLLGSVFPVLSQQEKSPLVFQPEVAAVGTLQQGEKVQVVLKGKNTSREPLQLESVISQNSGPENFRYPSRIEAGQAFTVEYSLNSAYMEGEFSHTIVLIEPSGKPHLTYASGLVNAPVWFSEKILDIGYYAPGSQMEWTFYAWNPGQKVLDLQLDSASAKEFSVQMTPVRLHVDNYEQIREGGKVPGLKIVLRPKNLGTPTGRSIRKIVSFRSTAFPLATPEVLVVGYWKS